MIRTTVSGNITNSSTRVTAKVSHMQVNGSNVEIARVAPGDSAGFTVDLKPGDRIKVDQGGTGVSVNGTGQTINDSETAVVFLPKVGAQQTLDSTNASAVGVTFSFAMGESGDMLQLLAV